MRAVHLDSGGSEKRGKTDLLRSAKFRHCAVEHVKVVEEIDGQEDYDLIDGERLKPRIASTHREQRAIRSDLRLLEALLQGVCCPSP
jgi:hypothetical protein